MTLVLKDRKLKIGNSSPNIENFKEKTKKQFDFKPT